MRRGKKLLNSMNSAWLGHTLREALQSNRFKRDKQKGFAVRSNKEAAAGWILRSMRAAICMMAEEWIDRAASLLSYRRMDFPASRFNCICVVSN